MDEKIDDLMDDFNRWLEKIQSELTEEEFVALRWRVLVRMQTEVTE